MSAHPNILAESPFDGHYPVTLTDILGFESHEALRNIAIGPDGVMRNAIAEWVAITGMDFSDLEDAIRAKSVSEFTEKASLIFAEAGYLVYRNDEYLAVFNPVSISDVMDAYKAIDEDDPMGTLLDELDFSAAAYMAMPHIEEAVKLLKEAKDSGSLPDVMLDRVNKTLFVLGAEKVPAASRTPL